jgi:thymidylate synthase (FAD)
VLEFADFTFHVMGASRALLAQITRHRVASFSVRSQRYCSEDNFGYVTPDTIENIPAAKLEYKKAINRIKETYEYLQELGVPNEDARFILPNACETIMEVKMNGRELIHFMNERLCTRAQWEIRNLAKAMKSAVASHDEQCAEFAKFLVPKCYANLKYPFCTEHKSCGLAPKLEDVYSTYLSTKEDNLNE